MVKMSTSGSPPNIVTKILLIMPIRGLASSTHPIASRTPGMAIGNMRLILVAVLNGRSVRSVSQANMTPRHKLMRVLPAAKTKVFRMSS